jgi:alpha-tubulin suppressor-like RCC1 family protein
MKAGVWRRRFAAAVASLTVVGVAPAVGVAAEEPADGPLPVVSLGDVTVLEPQSGTRAAFVPVHLSAPAPEPVVVTFHTSGGTATEGTDLSPWGTPATPRTLTIAAGSVQTTINVPVRADADVEDDETFLVTATGVTGATLGRATATATVLDPDALASPLPVLAVVVGDVTEGDSGVRRAQFHLQLSEPVGSPLAVAYRSEDGTATAPGDYTAKPPGTATLVPGQLMRTIDVQVPADTTVDGDRAFSLVTTVTGGPSVEELTGTATTTILDDDREPPNQPPVARLDATPASGTAPLEVVLDATGTGDPDGSVAATSIDPGDGSPATPGPTATHTYGIGSWTATLTATDDDGATATATRAITVRERATVSTGGSHSCELPGDGTVRCWGANSNGQLGDGTTTDRQHPVTVAGISDAVAVSAGTAHTCAVLAGGGVRCWGQNTYRQLGDGTSVQRTTPVQPSGLSSATAVSAADRHTCARIADGTLRCWGENTGGQIGNGTITSSIPIPSQVVGISTAATVSASGGHTCAVLEDATVRCWGWNNSGQVGGGVSKNYSPVVVEGLSGVADLDTGDGASGGFTCAVLRDGSGRCWGSAYHGQLGDGGTTDRFAPVVVSGLSGAVGITAGYGVACALVTGGGARCWGSGKAGALGRGSVTDSSVPVTVSGLTGATAIDVGGAFAGGHACADVAVGTRCWGNHDRGQVGLGVSVDTATPVDARGPVGVASLSAGGAHTCAVATTRSVWCWGDGARGQLGVGGPSSWLPSPSPAQVSGLTDAVAVSSGELHTCALRTTGTVRCWGDGADGQLGNGPSSPSGTPVDVPGVSGAVAIDAGAYHTCALVTGGRVRCWGRNSSGQLGTGGISSVPGPATEVVGVVGATTMAAGLAHSCAVVSGALRCWGANTSGQLGTGTTTSSAVPVPWTGTVPVDAVSAGSAHTCARRVDGILSCWGGSGSGIRPATWPLGSFTSTPANVPGLPAVRSFDAGTGRTCAVLNDGTGRCWGTNDNGQLGDGTKVPSLFAPVTVVGLTGATLITTGGAATGTTCAATGPAAGGPAAPGSSATAATPAPGRRSPWRAPTPHRRPGSSPFPTTPGRLR